MASDKTITLKTSMTCKACVAKVRPALEAQGLVRDLQFDMNSSDKTVSFSGDQNDAKKAIGVLQSLGYHASVLKGPVDTVAAALATPTAESFKPLILIAVYLIGITAIVEINSAELSLMRAMNTFMGGFFVVFSFFKFLDLPKFADAFMGYDVVGRHSRLYGLCYPFIEVALGTAYLLHLAPLFTNAATLVLMIVGNIGVINVLRKKQTIQCACLGTVFNLPMTKVTLFENTLMLVMSLSSLSIF